MDAMKSMMERAMNNAKANAERRAKVYRFDIFKGVVDSEGKIQKIRSIGAAQLMEGARTYTVYLKSLLKDVFYLMPEEKKLTRGDYVILTREPSPNPPRKFYWNNIGEGFILSGPNAGIMRLDWDFFGGNDIYMSLHPTNRAEAAVEVSVQNAA
jgi:hypothetical protein